MYEKFARGKSNLVNIASHQLRTPVSIIRIALSMVVAGDVTGKKKDEYVENAYKASSRLEELVSDLLAATELESGKVELNLKETDIEALTKVIMDELRPKAEEKNLVFEYQSLTKPLPKVKVDSVMIKEAIVVLVDNALLYTPKGFVNVFCQIKDKDFILSVKDSGTGLTKEDLPKLYEKFARGKEAMLVVPNGTGLGLYNAKMMVELHGGKIEVESKGRGKGTTFSIILPLK